MSYRGLSRSIQEASELTPLTSHSREQESHCANHGMSRPGILLNYCVSCRNGYGGGDHRGCVPLCILDSSLAIDPSLAPFPSGPTTRGLAFCHFTSAREYPIRPGPCTKVPNILTTDTLGITIFRGVVVGQRGEVGTTNSVRELAGFELYVL